MGIVFSILLPSRNRLALLEQALETLKFQGDCVFEVIVCDNASDPPYPLSLVSDFGLQGRTVRHEEGVSVTENWTTALSYASGDYILMLGDDDGLTVNSLPHLQSVLRQWALPDVVYMPAYHYYEPGAVPGFPQGGLREVYNSSLFSASESYLCATADRYRCAKQMGMFRHLFSFNAQHFVVKRSLIERIGYSNFYQPPYPDYFSAVLSFLLADRVVVLPKPNIVIGVSRQSFGSFLMHGKEEVGHAQFLHFSENSRSSSLQSQDLIDALCFPGSQHYRNWLLTALRLRSFLAPAIDFQIDLRRYRRFQLIQVLKEFLSANPQLTYSGMLRATGLAGVAARDSKDYHDLRDLIRTIYHSSVVSGLSQGAICANVEQLMNVYYPARVVDIEVPANSSLAEAISFIGTGTEV